MPKLTKKRGKKTRSHKCVEMLPAKVIYHKNAKYVSPKIVNPDKRKRKISIERTLLQTTKPPQQRDL